MSWFNYYGLIFIVLIMLPNIVYSIKNKNSITNNYTNKIAEIFEQIGRYACMAFMIFNIPYTWFGFYFDYANIVYIVVNSALVTAYCIIWIILWNKDGMLKSLLLSILPSLVLIFSGVITASIPLIIFAIIFAVTHILISVKNTPKNINCPIFNCKLLKK